MCLDSSFIGSIEKDKTTLVKEHKELFETANKNELDKKVRHLWIESRVSADCGVSVFSSLRIR